MRTYSLFSARSIMWLIAKIKRQTGWALVGAYAIVYAGKGT